jgi:hypothetical protein
LTCLGRLSPCWVYSRYRRSPRITAHSRSNSWAARPDRLLNRGTCRRACRCRALSSYGAKGSRLDANDHRVASGTGSPTCQEPVLGSGLRRPEGPALVGESSQKSAQRLLSGVRGFFDAPGINRGCAQSNNRTSTELIEWSCRRERAGRGAGVRPESWARAWRKAQGD